jgi:UPF0271 protein
VLRAGAVCDGPLPVLGLPGSKLLAVAEGVGLPVVAEAFADRAYTWAGALVPRTEAGAVVHDPESVITRAVGIARDGTVTAAGGEPVAVQARSLCVHGDTPGAAQLAWRVRGALATAGVRVEPFS